MTTNDTKKNIKHENMSPRLENTRKRWWNLNGNFFENSRCVMKK